MLKEGYGNYIS